MAYAFVMPVLLVNDGALWAVDYDEDGTRADPLPVDDAHYFADASNNFPQGYAIQTYRMGHLHIYTRTGFERVLDNYSSPAGTMWERTFGTAVRAG